jgi:ankyrin repeat protein
VCRASSQGRWDLVRVLVDAGASPNARCTGVGAGDRDATPLHRAAAEGDLEMVEYLLAHGAEPLAEGAEKLLPVELARGDAVRAALEKAGGRGP